MERVVDIIDEAGTVLRSERLEIAHARHLLHRSIHLLVVNHRSEVFVRLRPRTKPIYAHLWTSSVDTHVLSGTTARQTAEANLPIFLGMTAPLAEIAERRIDDRYENEIITISVCHADAIGTLNEAESEDGRYMTVAAIRQLAHTGRATPHLVAAVDALGQCTVQT